MRVDLPLVRRVEHTSAVINARHAAAMATLSPDSNAVARSLDLGALVSLGPGRYVNRAVGVGFGGTGASELVDAIDSFYGERHMAPSLELSSWADTALVTLLAARGYRLEWFRGVYATPVPGTPVDAPVSGARIEPLSAATAEARKAVLAGDAAPGSDARRISDEMCDLATVPHDSHDFVALVDGAAVACGSVDVADGIAWFGGAATRRDHRGHGLQRALLHHRLRLAHELGLELAVATALPNGQSARNMLACGFQLLYTQVVLTRP